MLELHVREEATREGRNGEGDRLGRVRVVTPNLWGRRGAWAERRSVLAEGLRELRPDLVAFQEAVVNDG